MLIMQNQESYTCIVQNLNRKKVHVSTLLYQKFKTEVFVGKSSQHLVPACLLLQLFAILWSYMIILYFFQFKLTNYGVKHTCTNTIFGSIANSEQQSECVFLKKYREYTLIRK